MVQATYDDANLILKLYELRREEKMREARAWFVGNFKPKSLKDVQELCPPGSDNSARMRMVVSYWDMAASFVSSGILNPELFFANCREALLVWIRVQAFAPELRSAFKDPTMWNNLEEVSKHFVEWMNKTSPGTYEALVARIG